MATAVTPNKSITLPSFEGEAEKLEAYISGIETGYRANNWNDELNPYHTLQT